MSHIVEQNAKRDPDDPDFDKRIRVFYPAHVSDRDPVSSSFEMATAEQGLPGGHPVDNPQDLFKKFNIWVSSQESRFHPPTSYGDSGDGVPLQVEIRANRVDDFTGAELRVRKARPEQNEVNELELLNSMLTRVFQVMQRDLTGSVASTQAQSARQTIGEILVQLGARLSADRHSS